MFVKPARHFLRPWLLVLVLPLLLIGCSSKKTPDVAISVQPTTSADFAPIDSLVDIDLLAAPGVVIRCDSSENAELVCNDTDGTQSLQTAILVDGYARWSLRFPQPVHHLSGREVLTLHRQNAEKLSPNIYLVEENGTRTYVPLERFGRTVDWHTVHIPLARFTDSEGKAVDSTALREIQIVFEWADMQGEFLLDSLRFSSIWEEEVESGSVDPHISVPDGFVIEAVIQGSQNPTQMETPSANSLLVSEQTGRIWWYWDDDNDGKYERRQLYDTGYSEVVGLLYDPTDGAVWVGGRGQLWRTLDSDGDGVADVKELRIDGLLWGRHQNNGLEWNPVVDPFTGEPAFSWLYFGLGALGDIEDDDDDLNASVLRFPRSGQSRDDLEVVSRGNRNAYDLLWAPVPVDGETVWSLFASENGPDFIDAPDEVNHILWGQHYGFPHQFGRTVDSPADSGYTDPVTILAAHASANGLAYVTNPTWPTEYRTLYVSLFGEIFGTGRAGHTVERIELSPVESSSALTFQGDASTFIDGLDRPLALTTDKQGQLLVADYAVGTIYRVRYVGQ